MSQLIREIEMFHMVWGVTTLHGAILKDTPYCLFIPIMLRGWIEQATGGWEGKKEISLTHRNREHHWKQTDLWIRTGQKWSIPFGSPLGKRGNASYDVRVLLSETSWPKKYEGHCTHVSRSLLFLPLSGGRYADNDAFSFLHQIRSSILTYREYKLLNPKIPLK